MAGTELPWRNSAALARKALGQWQTRNDKRMLAVMTADRPGRDAQRREDLEPCLVAAQGDLHQTLLDQVNAL